MFKAEIDLTTARKAVDALLAITTEARLRITKEGISTRAIDSANVALVDFHAPSSIFKSYERDKDLTIGIDLERLNAMLRMGVVDDTCKVEIAEIDRMALAMGKLKYSHSLLSEKSIRADPEVKEMTYPGNVTLPGSEFENMVRVTGSLGADFATFVVETDPTTTFKMLAENDAKNTVKIELTSEDITIVLVGEKEISSMFSTSLIKLPGKVVAGIEKVKLSIGQDFLLQMNFNIGDIAVKYILAPKIKAD